MIKRKKDAQIGMEYLIIVGFLTFVLIGTLGVALYHNNAFMDLIVTRQVENMAGKILSSAEIVFYSGEPSKITIVSYIPRGIIETEISDNILFITYETSTGINKVSFLSNVPITGTVPSVSGVRELIITANDENVVVSS